MNNIIDEKIGPQETIFDEIGRKFVNSLIKDQKKIIVFGSPDAREFSLVKNDIVIHAFDFVQPESIPENVIFIAGNVFDFDFSNEQADLVFNRWFLHHCNTQRKKQFIEIAMNLIDETGKICVIDWFIPDYHNEEEYLESLLKYYEYHDLYKLAPSRDRWFKRAGDRESTDSRGGKFISRNKFEEMLAEKDLKFNVVPLCPDFVENPELLGQFAYLIRKY